MEQTEFLRQLYKECNLSESDVFIMKMGGKNIPIVTRSGIEKIQAAKDIPVVFDPIVVTPEFVVIKAIGQLGDVTVETFGEASPQNTKQKYPVAMAEKRALSRVVLKLTGIYQHGYLGEDELDTSEEIDVSVLLRMLETSTYDDDQRVDASLRIQNIETQDEYKQWFDRLNINQLDHSEQPGRRMSQTDVKNKLKEQGL